MARNRTAKDDPQFEITFYEGVLKHSPDFVQALSALAGLYTQEGLYAQGLALDRRLTALRPREPVAHYNLACSLSLVGDISGAFDAIKRALEYGYEDFAYLEKDSDLMRLLADPEFQEFYRGVKTTRNADERV